MSDRRGMLALAATQHSLVTRDQLTRLGLTRSAIRHLLSSGDLDRVTNRVLRLGGVPETPRQLACAAVLDCTSFGALSHESAAALWDIPGHALTPPIVSVVHGVEKAHDRLGTLRRSTHLPDHHTTIVDGIPVTYPARIVFDLAGQPGVHPDRIARLIDTMWGRRLVNYRILHSMLAEHASRGRPGTVLLRELLELRPADYRPPESNLEARVHQIVLEDRQPALERQVDVGMEHWIGRMDFIDRKARVIVQVDSEIHHGSVLDAARDDAQTAALELAGWIVVRVREYDVWHNKAYVQHQIRDARRRGRRRLASA
jgi:very-short-patch-repair endonuclease